MKIRAARSFAGTYRMPGDKSITHRSFIFGALAEGVTTIEGASAGGDCTSTRNCLASLGVRFDGNAGDEVIRAYGGTPLKAPASALDCGNSGTTLRLLMGVLAGSTFQSEMSGDASLNGRPMERVARPLREMGARIETTNGRPPVRVSGAPLKGASLTPEAASAQIKSAILLAALGAAGRTTVHEAVPTRDHTERMIEAFGGVIHRKGDQIAIDGPQKLRATHVAIPGDPSSAAPFIVAALVLQSPEVVIEGVLLNPHRVRYLEVLREMGARIETEIASAAGTEPWGRIIVRGSELRGIEVSPKDVAAIVDELPILAVAGAFASGTFQVRGAAELRVKESDRIASMVEGLQAMGADMQELEDGFLIRGGRALRGATLASHGDHRIAMALSIAALGAKGDSEIEGAEVVSISLPGFFDELERGVAS